MAANQSAKQSARNLALLQPPKTGRDRKPLHRQILPARSPYPDIGSVTSVCLNTCQPAARIVSVFVGDGI